MNAHIQEQIICKGTYVSYLLTLNTFLTIHKPNSKGHHIFIISTTQNNIQRNTNF